MAKAFLSTLSARRATLTAEIKKTFVKFLSTLSARRATPPESPLSSAVRFLSTPSARRATCAPTAEYLILEHFYPRPPRGGRRCSPCP